MPRLKKRLEHDFTIINNKMLRDNKLGATERGVLITMLCLPENWNFSIKGLSKILPDGITKISTALKNLEKLGYLRRERVYTDGKISDWDYIFSDECMEEDETEDSKNSDTEPDSLDTDNLNSANLEMENLESENLNQGHLDKEKPGNNIINNNQINKNQINKNKANKRSAADSKLKQKIAEAVSMSQEEIRKLVDEFGKPFTDKCIDMLNNYKLSSGKAYKSDYHAIRNWVIRRVTELYPELLKKSETVRQDNDDINPFADIE